jgi:hypothetical protein
LDEKFVCPCGLTCCDCLFYKKEIFETAQKLKELIKKYQFDKFLILLNKGNSQNKLGEHFELSENLSWEKFGQYFEAFKYMPEFMKVLDCIITMQCKFTCQEVDGCSFGGITSECEALKCIKAKKYSGCWQCEEFETCDKLQLLKKNYGYVIEENLKIIKEKGINAVESHGNKYYTWQRKTDIDVLRNKEK